MRQVTVPALLVFTCSAIALAMGGPQYAKTKSEAFAMAQLTGKPVLAYCVVDKTGGGC